MTVLDRAAETLKQSFGYDRFLEGQEEVVSRLIEGEDLCVIMPTGAGKSLCYQLPALLADGYTLIVSPLISLMKDQVDALVERGIEAAYINSTQSNAERQSVLSRWQSGRVKLLYVAPERLRLQGFRRMVQQFPPAFLVVDEAHCISQWGHDFRPDYARIGDFIDELQIGQIGAFTATATPIVQDDIVRQLHRPGMEAYVTGFTRPNLHFSVRNTSRNEDKLQFLRSLLKDPKPTIIYAATRKNVDLIGDELQCIRYHAGLEDAEREEAQNRFMQDSCPVIVATNAFGMGIDRPDIRRVVHYNVPGSLEAYYQEAGRAGRDGEDADCYLLFSHQDRYIHEFFIEMSNPPEYVVHATWQTLTLMAMQEGSAHLEVTQAELAQRVSGAKSDQQISAVLKILEKNGYLERGYRGANRGRLALLMPPEQVLGRFPAPTTQRALFIRQIIRAFGNQLVDGVECTYEELERESRLQPEQVKRVIRALDGVELTWDPPFSGRGVNLLRPDETTLDIDFSELKRHTEMEQRRLDLMFDYSNTTGCRQSYIIGYFGQVLDGWVCQVCDRCRSHEHHAAHTPIGAELQLVRTALSAVKRYDNRFGKNRIAQMLTGSRSREIFANKLHIDTLYGLLANFDQPTVIRLIEALLNARCLDTSGDTRFPCLRITDLGKSVLDGSRQVPIDFSIPSTDHAGAPAPSRGTGRTEQRSAAVDDDLLVRLRELRDELAAKRRVPIYQIFPNKTLQELAAKRPVTIAEARSISGIGPYKERVVLPLFLEVIKAWRTETNRAT